MNGFGASDQSAKLYEHFGITVAAIVQSARSMTQKPALT